MDHPFGVSCAQTNLAANFLLLWLLCFSCNMMDFSKMIVTFISHLNYLEEATCLPIIAQSVTSTLSTQHYMAHKLRAFLSIFTRVTFAIGISSQKIS